MATVQHGRVYTYLRVRKHTANSNAIHTISKQVIQKLQFVKQNPEVLTYPAWLKAKCMTIEMS